MKQSPAAVRPATVGPISDDILERLIGHMADLERGICTEEGGTLILMCARPCLEELLEHRRRAADSLELVPQFPDNVVTLPRPGA